MTVTVAQTDSLNPTAQQHTWRSLDADIYTCSDAAQTNLNSSFLWSHMENTATATRKLQTNNNWRNKRRKRRARYHGPAERQRDGSTNSRHQDAKSRALWLIHVSAGKGEPVSVKTFYFGIFSCQYSHKHALIYVAWQQDIFREERGF